MLAWLLIWLWECVFCLHHKTELKVPSGTSVNNLVIPGTSCCSIRRQWIWGGNLCLSGKRKGILPQSFCVCVCVCLQQSSAGLKEEDSLHCFKMWTMFFFFLIQLKLVHWHCSNMPNNKQRQQREKRRKNGARDWLMAAISLLYHSSADVFKLISSAFTGKPKCKSLSRITYSCVWMHECASRPQRELASKLLDVVKVATVVRELPSQSFIYPPTTKFDHVTLTMKKDMRK